ncbi:hypothetical protein [Carboxylicivirga sp. N1Y90]|uniref:hypothetical protein n=1 Tax=Carboxylicivirga fragile TaxID=3417571 RepID=UPI003D32821F|nr:hypothetical protein [Marinilabiliaceae bacterium N1Y90]
MKKKKEIIIRIYNKENNEFILEVPLKKGEIDAGELLRDDVIDYLLKNNIIKDALPDNVRVEVEMRNS